MAAAVIIAGLGLPLAACGHGSYRVEGTPWTWSSAASARARGADAGRPVDLAPPIPVIATRPVVAVLEAPSAPAESVTVDVSRKPAKKRPDGKRRRR
ncbi:MAG: hypothetical protein HY903_19770 [Deltaproteobacteria bacterium]|nr:hypothetical protein [Deltaproteobacteria bacterium]